MRRIDSLSRHARCHGAQNIKRNVKMLALLSIPRALVYQHTKDMIKCLGHIKVLYSRVRHQRQQGIGRMLMMFFIQLIKATPVSRFQQRARCCQHVVIQSYYVCYLIYERSPKDSEIMKLLVIPLNSKPRKILRMLIPDRLFPPSSYL